MPRRVNEIRLVVGTPEPKHIPQHYGGPTVAFQIRDDQQVQLAVEALDAEGNPANVTVTWRSDDDTIASVDANGLLVASPGAGGLGPTTVHADVIDASDGDIHTGDFEVEVVAGDAVIVNVTAGTPEPKPAVEPPPVEGPPVEPIP